MGEIEQIDEFKNFLEKISTDFLKDDIDPDIEELYGSSRNEHGKKICKELIMTLKKVEITYGERLYANGIHGTRMITSNPKENGECDEDPMDSSESSNETDSSDIIIFSDSNSESSVNAIADDNEQWALKCSQNQDSECSEEGAQILDCLEDTVQNIDNKKKVTFEDEKNSDSNSVAQSNSTSLKKEVSKYTEDYINSLMGDNPSEQIESLSKIIKLYKKNPKSDILDRYLNNVSQSY